MLFNSMQFLIFFPVVVCIYHIMPRRFKNLWLLLASYYFYMCWNAKYVFLLLFSTGITYASGILLECVKQKEDSARGRVRRDSYKKLIVAFSVVLNLSVLFYFKYSSFALDIFVRAFRVLHIELNTPALDIVLPVGISFYIFQALSYTMDVYRGEIYAEKNFFRYALFVSFFPQLVAGPIERSKNLLKQLSETGKFCPDRIREGLLHMLWGFFLKMVIADRCAVLVNTVYGNYMDYHGFQVITANVLFAFQIYCDFMGYSVIARGAAKILGYELMENFERPYMARSIRDFWRRWHISLSSWLRDYLYIPLGGSRHAKAVKYRNIMITFLVSGLWHGADFTFVVWGGIHGFYQIMEDVVSPFLKRLYEKLQVDVHNFSWNCMRVIITFVFTDLAWVFFRADTITEAFGILQNSLDMSNTGLVLNHGLCQLGLDERNMCILLLGIAVLAIHSLLEESGRDVLAWLSGQCIVFRYAAYWGVVLLLTFSLDITGQEFIYFQF